MTAQPPRTTGNELSVATPILTTHTEYSLPDFPYEETDRHTLPNPHHLYRKCGGELE
jgi:hypothetical protein